MNLELIALIAPIVGVIAFMLIEQLAGIRASQIKHRTITFVGMEACNMLTTIVLSLLVLTPLVYFLSSLQLFSFSTLDAPAWVVCVLSFLFLDLISYTQHYLHHKVPFLWRLHRLHHSDQHVDPLTAWLHHPLEMVSTFMMTVSLAVIFDVPVIVLTVYALVTALHAPFTHMRLLLPDRIAHYLQYIVITPNFHRVHHALAMKEGNSNFGGTLVCWDYLFGTAYTKNNKELHAQALGIEAQQAPDSVQLSKFLKNPFLRKIQ